MALPTLAVATPLGFRVWNPRDQVKFRVHKRLTRTCSADLLGGGAGEGFSQAPFCDLPNRILVLD